MTRLGLAAALLVLLAALEAGAAPAGTAPTGPALPGLETFDELMTGLLKKWDVPGAALAVAHRDKLLLARGYGLANKERAVAVGPTSLFRIGSLSKTITAVAVLQLVQAGRLGLDDKVLPLLGDMGPRSDHVTDARVRDITVRHLLQHTGGFDRERSGDVVFMPRAAEAARRQGGPLPPDCPTILRDTLEHKLDFTPGERFAYSNVGFCILGRIVERVSGSPYESYAREHVLAPAGAARMRVGRTLQAAEGEVRYYDYRGAKEVKAMPGLGLTVAPQPYGAFALEAMDSYGGWIGAPVDYLRFILAIDGRRGPALLQAATLAEMNAQRQGVARRRGIHRQRRVLRPRDPDPARQDGANLFHTGSIPGHEHPGRSHRRRIRVGRRVQQPAAGQERLQRRRRSWVVGRQGPGQALAERRSVRTDSVRRHG